MNGIEDNSYQNTAFNGEIHYEQSPAPEKNKPREQIIVMNGGDTMQAQMSVEGAHQIAALSPRITVTFHDVTKVIRVPAKMIDPTSKEKFIERTLLDKVSGQILPGQVVALMGPSGNSILYIIICCIKFFLLQVAGKQHYSIH
jgi:ABC-type multidrug transport system ATPase subunit